MFWNMEVKDSLADLIDLMSVHSYVNMFPSEQS